MKIKTTEEIYVENSTKEYISEGQNMHRYFISDEANNKWVSVDSLIKWIDKQTPIFDDNCSKGVDIEDLKEALKGQSRPSNVRTR